MTKRHAQSGITLVVSLIMLIVLTLLVVSAIRFGNINLKIAANAQVETEATAATQAALEQMVAQVSVADRVDGIPAQTISVSTGGATYTVVVSQPSCLLNKNIKAQDLDANNPIDRVCFEGSDGEKQIDANGNLTTAPTACKDQQWDIAASLPNTSGVSVQMVQGVALRVGAEVQCPGT